jgi:hypothetical protein
MQLFYSHTTTDIFKHSVTICDKRWLNTPITYLTWDTRTHDVKFYYI